VCTHILIIRNKPLPSSPKSGKHVDPLPPFNLTLLFSNELGYASYQRLLGVSFVDDGAVYSIQDQFSERTLVLLAEDFTELMPLTLSSLYQPLRSATQRHCVSARIFVLHQVFLSTGEATFPRVSGPLLGTGPRPYRKTRRPMLCSGSRRWVPCIDRGVAVYRTAGEGKWVGWDSVDILQMMMTMMTIAGIGKIEEPGDGWWTGVAGGGSWLSVAGGALGDIPVWNKKGSGRSGSLRKPAIWG